jgi:hypothetical protein
MAKQTSFKLWEGKSPHDGSDIVAIITNVGKASTNPKTGPMCQLWILPKNVEPWLAITSGQDDGVCGDCIYAPTKAKRARELGHDVPSCYVARRGWQAPASVWKSSINRPVQLTEGLAAIKTSGMSVRYGAWGDPAMLPQSLIDAIKEAAGEATKGKKAHTAYTHAPHRRWAGFLKGTAMASVNNAFDGEFYRALGWRTFRVTDGEESGADEIVCPNYTHGVQCITCGLCDGSRGPNDKRKSITIPRH